MPVLTAEPDLFPAQLFDDLALVENRCRRRLWRVLHTKPRQEKSLARELYERQLAFYLPLFPRKNLIRGRVLTSYLPLFTSYVFLLGDKDERLRALQTRRVVQIIDVVNQEKLRQDLAQVRRLIQTQAPIIPEDRLVPGAAVEIRSGPLKGLRGKILHTATGQRFVVEVDFIQRGASVEMDAFMLAALSD